MGEIHVGTAKSVYKKLLGDVVERICVNSLQIDKKELEVKIVTSCGPSYSQSVKKWAPQVFSK